MKKNLLTNLTKTLLALLMFLMVMPAQAEMISEEEVVEGREFWFGIPHCGKNPAEPIRWGEFPIELWISSRENTTVRLRDAEGSLDKSYAVIANTVLVVEIPDHYENKLSEIVQSKGLHIQSLDPITVAVFTAYRWSGEAYRVTPVEWLGRKYYTLNMYQDQVKMQSGPTEYKPAQILVVATQDNTTMRYRPTYKTQGGVNKGQMAQVTLQQGETFLILGEINENLTHDWMSDLTGTYIESNHPVAVISGHTKGSFPRHTATMLGLKSDFMRNMLTDMMWPVELLGREYVSVPFRYSGRATGYGTVPDDRGDIIRFVATVNGTRIYEMREDGSSWRLISPALRAGEWYDILSQEKPSYYRADQPVLVGQYGKSWWSSAVTPIINSKDDEVQNPPRCGQGQMTALAPIEQWCSYAGFYSPPGMDNWVYITFNTGDEQHILLDGETLSNRFGAAIRKIPGSPFSYINELIGPRGHHIDVNKKNVKFAAYVYGNLDGGKDGFAYSYPAGINYLTPCDDSLYVIDEYLDCGTVNATAHAVDLQTDTVCASIFNILYRGLESENYRFDIDPGFESGSKYGKYSLTVIDTRKPAFGKVTVMTRSGKTITKTYEYTPEILAVDPDDIDFGLLQLNLPVCRTFLLKNEGEVELTVQSLRLKNNVQNFAINTDDLPVTIPAGESFSINVCATAFEMLAREISDIIIGKTSCFEDELVVLRFTTGEPIMTVEDAHFGSVPINDTRTRNVKIENIGTFKLEIYEIDWTNKVNFPKVENLTFPLNLEPGQSHNFTVFYTPAGESSVPHVEKAIFTANAEKVKLFSDWTGIGIDAGPTIEGYDWQKRRVIDEYAQAQGITEYQGTVTVDNIGTVPLSVTRIFVENDPNNVFRLDQNQIQNIIVNGLNPNNPIEIDAFFAPKAQEDYHAKVIIETMFNQEVKVAEGVLLGTGIQPHIDVTGKDYGILNLNEVTYKEDKGYVYSMNPHVGYGMELTVFDISIQGPDADKFIIAPGFVKPTQANPIKIPVGNSLEVPINFVPGGAGVFNARIVAVSDAPSADNHEAELIGRAFSTGLTTTDYPFPPTFITLFDNRGEVRLTNTGTVPMTITRDITLSFMATNPADVNDFNITEWYIASNPTVKNMNGRFDIPAGDDLVVKVTFAPKEEKTYSTYIEYQVEMDGSPEPVYARSNITGEGIVYRVVASIPTGYRAFPGEVFGENGSVRETPIEFKLKKTAAETRQLQEANITTFKAAVRFRPIDRDQEVIDVFPVIDNLTADIIKEGTMTANNWECYHVGIDNTNSIMSVYMRSTDGQPLRATNETLFKFKLRTYVSELDVIPLGVDFVPQEAATGYVLVDTIPGDVRINPVCVNTTRLIQITGANNVLNQNIPNPVNRETRISYAIALNCTVNIELYDSRGTKVATLIHQRQSPGVYEFTFDVSELDLPSGVYNYRIQAGPFTDSKTMVITR